MMANLWGKQYSREVLAKYTGSTNQIAGTKTYELKDGKAFGVRGIDVQTGSGLEFTVLPDRCMDIAHASFKGKSLCLISKNGIVSSKYYDPEENNWFRSYFAGLLTTCGLSNTGACCELDGEKYGLHGRISNTPAEKVNVTEEWNGDEFEISISGGMRESSFYGENLLLTRKITTCMGSKKLVIADSVVNQGFSSVPLMLLYHFNIGFPLLDSETELILRGKNTRFYDSAAEEGKDRMKVFQRPTHDYFRQVFFHNLHEDRNGDTMVAVVNRELGNDLIGLFIKFNKRQLPEFFEFKMMGEGDYQLGLEPSNCLPMGRAYESQRDGLKYIEPQETKKFSIEIGVIETEEDLQNIGNFFGSLGNNG